MAKYRLRTGFGEHYRYNGTALIKVEPESIIECAPEEVAAVMDKFELIEEDKPAEPQHKFVLQPLPGGFFHVINPITKKQVNSKRLTKEEAEILAGFTVEEYEAKLAQEEATQKEADRKQALIDKILAVDGCTLKAEELAELSCEDLEALAKEDPKPKTDDHGNGTGDNQ
jgi:hypothetical protein